MKKILSMLLLGLVALDANAITRSWTNTAGGDWFASGNWSPNGVPAASDNVLITTQGTYTVFAVSSAVNIANLTLGGASSGAQTLIQGSTSVLNATNLTDVKNNGILAVTNTGFQGRLLIEAGGQLQLNSAAGLFLYNAVITNLGTVNWTSGSLAVGGDNAQTTIVSNGGSWLISGDNSINYGGGNGPMFINAGILRKSAGSNSTTFGSMDLINLPGALVDAESGTMRFTAYGTNFLGGTFSAAASTQIIFVGGCTDAGGITSGAGAFQFLNGGFYLRTNTIPGVKLLGGDIYIDTNHFQLGGAITNLTLDGAVLHGSNRVAGTLTFNAGSLVDQITVLPSGQLTLATSGSKLLYTLDLINQGTVNWTQGGLDVGGTPPTVISNGGQWLLSSDDPMSYGGGNTPAFTNAGVFRKTAGAGGGLNSSLAGVAFVNLPGAVIEADAGALDFPSSYTNVAGEIRLNGGAIQAFGGFTFSAGLLDGSGAVGQCAFLGGTISPGLSGPGTITFPQGLTLGSNATVSIDGLGMTPGSQYDQLVVTGPVALGNCHLQVTSLPAVPVGAAFIIITNTFGPVTETFNNLPTDAPITVSGQPFRIHYASAGGSAVTLVRDTASHPLLSLTGGGYNNGALQFTGTTLPSQTVTIQATTNFLQWTTLGTALADPTGQFSFTDPNASQFRYRFYRVTN